MIGLPAGTRIYLACGPTDMRRGFDGLALLVQEVLAQDPFSGALFAFRGKRGDLIKLLWWDTQGLCLFAKRLEQGRFIWPMAIGRRNWLFAGSKAGGERAAAIYSIIETCKLNGVEPLTYITDVMQKITANWPNSRIGELMPWAWAKS